MKNKNYLLLIRSHTSNNRKAASVTRKEIITSECDCTADSHYSSTPVLADESKHNQHIVNASAKQHRCLHEQALSHFHENHKLLQEMGLLQSCEYWSSRAGCDRLLGSLQSQAQAKETETSAEKSKDKRLSAVLCIALA